MSKVISMRWICLLLLTLAIGLGCSGCGTTEAENTSARPWNSPEGWQNGSIPSMMTQPR